MHSNEFFSIPEKILAESGVRDGQGNKKEKEKESSLTGGSGNAILSFFLLQNSTAWPSFNTTWEERRGCREQIKPGR